MALYLGLDTSNYASSAALYDTQTDKVYMNRKLLPVQEGSLGLRQSEAVFLHVKQFSDVINELLRQADCAGQPLSGIGVSVFPRRAEGSYMPCFLVGKMVAEALAGVNQLPCYTFSHQEGHITSALYSSGCMSFFQKRFLAFHVSGGTTEAVLVEPSASSIFSAQLVAKTLDLHAGQLVDRIGGLLGCKFPAGPEVEALAANYTGIIRTRATLKGADVCLSGIENQCRKLLDEGRDASYIARFCLESICSALCAMVQKLTKEYGNLPVVFAGGVMSNLLIRNRLAQTAECYFAEPSFSADNAAGIAILASRKGKKCE